MSQLYSNFQVGTITDAPLLVGATSANSANFANLPTVTAPDTMWLVLDPEGANGAPEIVSITAHTAAATVVTIVRAQQSTVAREHPAASVWRVAVTKSDLDSFLVSDDLDGYATEAYADALGTDAATPSTIMRRDADGRAKIDDPTAADDIATKGYADALGTWEAAADSIMRRDVNGRVDIVTPVTPSQAATKSYVDALAVIAGTTDGTIEYKKIGSTLVMVTARGLTAAYTLPAGYRPAVALVIPAVQFSGGQYDATQEVNIATSGAITKWNSGLSSFENPSVPLYFSTVFSV